MRRQSLDEGSVVRHLFGGLLDLLFFLTAFSQEGSTGIPPNEGKTLGKPLPNVRLINSYGEEFDLYSLKGKPIILSPIYTNCSSACPIITDSLKKALPGRPGEDFWVISLTFDPTDRLKNIKDFQEKHGLDGKGWIVAMVKSKEDLFRLLDAIDFRFMSIPESKDFVHPNLLVFISPDMKIKRYVYGVVFDKKELEEALDYAKGKAPLWEKVQRFLFFIALLGLILTGIYTVITLARYLQRREEAKKALP